MHDKPDSLENFCIDALCDSIFAFCGCENKQQQQQDCQIWPPGSPSSGNSTSGDQQNLHISLSTGSLASASSTFSSSSSSFSDNENGPNGGAVGRNSATVEQNAGAGNAPASRDRRSCQNLNETTSTIPKTKLSIGSLKFKQEQPRLANELTNVCHLPINVSDALLRRLNEKRQLNNKTLRFFTFERTKLKNVKISDNNSITHEGLKIFKEHNLHSLRLINVKGIHLDKLISQNLNKHTVENLFLLDLTGTLILTQIRHDSEYTVSKLNMGFCINFEIIVDNVAEICKFSNLRSLIVARTEFGDSGLVKICENLHHLELLDLSHTRVTDIEPLLRLKNTLKFFVMQRPRIRLVDPTLEILCSLSNLEILDISEFPKLLSSAAKFSKNSKDPCRLGVLLVQKISEGEGSLKNLTFFDISGSQANFEVNVFSSFLKTHPNLRYCGLLMSNACYFDCVLSMKQLKVSGEANKAQIFSSLETYWSRDYFCTRSFHLLFQILENNFQSLTPEDKDFCIEHILNGLSANLMNLSVQMAGTACLYNFCGRRRAEDIHPALIRRIVDRSLTAIEAHAKIVQLHKNVWLTLCNDHVLISGTFDLFRCCSAALESMVNCNDAQVTQITIAIVSILAAKIPTELTSRLGSNRSYMKFLLKILNEKVDQQLEWRQSHAEQMDADPNFEHERPSYHYTTLKYALSALWNLTDESPVTCSSFLDEQGLDGVLRVLQLFNNHHVEVKVLGLLNNVAEVDHLKAHLVNELCLNNVRRLLFSPKIDVSYFSAGILAHLCADNRWDHFKPTWVDCLDSLQQAISGWTKPYGEMVAYRSFKPFFRLLQKDDLPAVQHWALWAIDHVCSTNTERYVDMFIIEGGIEALKRVRDNTRLKYASICLLCDNILHILTSQ